MWLAIYSIGLTVAWVVVTVYVLVNARRVRHLKDLSPAEEPLPPLAVIVPVRNEEAEVEAALTSVLRLDYPGLQIIVINDRSTDTTPQILEKMAAAHPRLTLQTITELPEGWLGKNHALYQGYKATATEWMLFTDADVLFSPQALRKAMYYAQEKALDHLVVMPEVTSPSALFKAVMNTFALMLDVRQRPWAVSNPRSSASIGIGAFNLVRRTAYEKAGTHAAFSLRPDDDLKLGEHIKKAGFRPDILYGNGEVSLQWYTNLGEFIRGLMKNTFSVANYNPLLAAGFVLATLAVFVLPIPLSLLWGGVGYLMAAAMLVSHVILLAFKPGVMGKWWHGLMLPFAGAIMAYIITASALKTLRQGGIYWRDHFYPLKELRKQR
jgi:cellulose synthase/poly-beta-1,6-N-acetylglucosamine synthase-like glycosyltransferase